MGVNGVAAEGTTVVGGRGRLERLRRSNFDSVIDSDALVVWLKLLSLRVPESDTDSDVLLDLVLLRTFFWPEVAPPSVGVGVRNRIPAR